MFELSPRKTQRIEQLRHVRLFSGCSAAELRRVASLTTEVYADAGQLLTRQGEPGSEFFVIVRGTVAVMRDAGQLAELGEGSFFGELALLDGGARTATVVATSDVHLLVLSRREFVSLCYALPTVTSKLLAELSARLRHVDSLVDAAAQAREDADAGQLTT